MPDRGGDAASLQILVVRKSAIRDSVRLGTMRGQEEKTKKFDLTFGP
jgi:hypothetical protein